MIKVRMGMFETNSSSTHSICIGKEVELTFPKSIYLQCDFFGWEVARRDTIATKASYLYTGLALLDRLCDIKKLKKLLESKGISVECEDLVYKNGFLENNGGIDHVEKLIYFLDDLFLDEQKILNFLFSPYSFILTGNDNDESAVTIKVSYPHYVYEKGN